MSYTIRDANHSDILDITLAGKQFSKETNHPALNTLNLNKGVGEERKYKSVPVTVSDASDEDKALNIISYVHSSNVMESDVYEQIMSGARTKRIKMLFDTSLNSFKKIESGVP